jgi:hypothetical protein
LKNYLNNKKLRIIFAGTEIKEEYNIVKVQGKYKYSYPKIYSFGIYDRECAYTHNRHGRVVQAEETIFKLLLERVAP